MEENAAQNGGAKGGAAEDRGVQDGTALGSGWWPGGRRATAAARRETPRKGGGAQHDGRRRFGRRLWRMMGLFGFDREREEDEA